MQALARYPRYKIFFRLEIRRKSMGKSKHSKRSKRHQESDDEIADDQSKSRSRSHHRKHSKHSKPSRRKAAPEPDDISDIELVDGDDSPDEELTLRIKKRLKREIITWLNNDDIIKEMSKKMKEYKDEKKKTETAILDMVNRLNIMNDKFLVNGEDNQFRSRVYCQRSVSRGAINKEVLQDALGEILHDEKKVSELIKKIEDKRPITERCYLKRDKTNRG